MSEDSFIEVSEQGWFGRLGGAFKGILVGLVFIIGSGVLLFWNEGRAVRRQQALEEGAGAVVSVPADSVDPDHDGDLVHITGEASTDEVLTDPEFGIEVRALRLRRKVEMYQWDEDKETRREKKLGGGERKVTKYTYEKVWSSRLIKSSDFKKPAGHENPQSMPYTSRTQQAKEVHVGAFRLTEGLVEAIDQWESLDPGGDLAIPERVADRARKADGGLYIGDTPSSPDIGDLRIRWSVVEPAEVSLVSRQIGDTFEPYTTSNGEEVELLELGARSAEAMFKAAEEANATLTWILRGVGLFVMFLGFTMVFKPLSVLADVIPLLGNLVEAGTGVVSALLAGSLSLVIIAVAWIFYRPLLASGLLAAGAVLVFAAFNQRKK